MTNIQLFKYQNISYNIVNTSTQHFSTHYFLVIKEFSIKTPVSIILFTYLISQL